MQRIHQKYSVHASLPEVWQALVNPRYIHAWGGGPARMDEKVGTHFSLWGGDIHGTNIEVIPQEKLVQEWFGGKWDKPSVVTFTLSFKHDVTTIDFIQIDVPDSERKDIEEGWKSYFLGPLKDYIEAKKS